MLWRFYVYLAVRPLGFPRAPREVLFKLNGAKLSEPGGPIEVAVRCRAAVCKLLSRGDNLNAYFASYIILLLPAKLSLSVS